MICNSHIGEFCGGLNSCISWFGADLRVTSLGLVQI